MATSGDFFLGANTPKGFHSLFRSLYDPKDGWQAYLIKGGPGTGKSGLMKRVADALEAGGHPCHRAACSSDPQSLDAVICPSKKICLADATAPHVIEPSYPGAVETLVNLGECWDKDVLLKNQNEIIACTNAVSAQHQRCIRFLTAAHAVKSDLRRSAALATDLKKVERYAARLAARCFGKPSGHVGMERQCFLSVVAPGRIETCYATMEKAAEQIYCIRDPWGYIGPYIANQLRCYALGCGLDVISCLCPLDPTGNPEHILVPQAGFAFFTANAAHPAQFANATTLRADRFLNRDLLPENKCKTGFCRRTLQELVEEATVSLAKAKDLHDVLESHYVKAMNFTKVESVTKGIIDEILG